MPPHGHGEQLPTFHVGENSRQQLHRIVDDKYHLMVTASNYRRSMSRLEQQAAIASHRRRMPPHGHGEQLPALHVAARLVRPERAHTNCVDERRPTEQQEAIASHRRRKPPHGHGEQLPTFDVG